MRRTAKLVPHKSVLLAAATVIVLLLVCWAALGGGPFFSSTSSQSSEGEEKANNHFSERELKAMKQEEAKRRAAAAHKERKAEKMEWERKHHFTQHDDQGHKEKEALWKDRNIIQENIEKQEKLWKETKAPFPQWNKDYFEARRKAIESLAQRREKEQEHELTSHEFRNMTAEQRAKHQRLSSSVHIVVGGDCTYYTRWQAAGLEHSYKRYFEASSKNRHVFLTRLVAGCERETDHSKVASVRKTILSPNEGAVFMTPAFSQVGNSFDPYNHPGMLHYWARHVDLSAEDYVIIADLDAVFVKSFSTFELEEGMVAPAEFLQDFEGLKKKLTRTSHTGPCDQCPTLKDWAFMKAKTRGDLCYQKPSGGSNTAVRRGKSSSGGSNNINVQSILDTFADAHLSEVGELVKGTDGKLEPRLKPADSQPPAVDEWKKGGCSFVGPYVVSSRRAAELIKKWDVLTAQARKADEGFWGIEWYSMAMSFATLPIRPIISTKLSISHPTQPGLFKGYGGLSFSSKLEEVPLMLHYGHRGVGWYEYGGERSLEQHSQLSGYEKDHKQPEMSKFHFSKFRLPSDWPGGGRPSNLLLQCSTPILQQLTTPTLWYQTYISGLKSAEQASSTRKEALLVPPSPNDGGDAGASVEEQAANWINEAASGKFEGKITDPSFPSPVIASRKEIRSAMMLQLLTQELNDGFTAFKKEFCPSSEKINLEERTRSLHPGNFVSAYDTASTRPKSPVPLKEEATT